MEIYLPTHSATISERPTLTIAIPTFNRAGFLSHTLERIQIQRSAIENGKIELLVCDNHSDDSTQDVLRAFQALDPSIRITRHDTNIGPDSNIVACFMLARGRYVWILGDDDFPVDGLLARLIPLIEECDYGLVYLKPYGYDVDSFAEHPIGLGGAHEYTSLAAFLYRVGAHLTFISSILVYKDLVAEHDFFTCEANNLLQLEIYLAAAARSTKYLYMSRYSVACKRNNSGGYDFSEVFVTRLFAVIENHVRQGMPETAARALRNAMMLRFYPQNVLFMRLRRDEKLQASYLKFLQNFKRSPLFWVIVAPIFNLPRWPAIAWGGAWTLAGRGLGGDLMRGIQFAYHGLKRVLLVRLHANP
ncbi:abequosyltransferase RfbV [mine drainage metagenome]|uniref:Abequosyltransferase RfbV n=1 Tax=mine drainage metagenome TaxID=410659 RepID=A0A1J5QXK9_9ZZZZ